MEADPTPDDFLDMFSAGPSVPTATTRPAPTSTLAPAAAPATPADAPITIDDTAPAVSPLRASLFALISRRLVIRLLAMLVGFGIFGLAISRMEAAQPRTGSAAKATPTVPAGPKPAGYGVAQALVAAAAYHQSHGTYVGFAPARVLVASGKGTVVIASMSKSGMCSFGGILAGVSKAPRNDPTAAACDPANVAQAQASIRSQELASAAPTSIPALNKAAGDAAFYASEHGGSLNGITFSDPSITPVANVSTGVLVHVATTSGCAQSMVSPNGTYTQPSPC